MRPAVLLACIVLIGSLPSTAGLAGDTPAELTLDGPAFAGTGATVRISGSLSLAGAPLVAQSIDIYRDGAFLKRDSTTTRGTYETSVPLPSTRTTTVLHTAWKSSLGDERSPGLAITTVAPPAPPIDVVAATSAGLAPVLVSWSAPVDDGGGPITSYRVERRVDGSAWTSRATTTAPSLSDASAPFGSLVAYRVLAANAAGEGARSAEAATTLAPDAPRSVQATVASDGASVIVTWQPPVGGAVPLAGYRLVRDDATLAVLPASSTAATDSAPPPLGRATYRVAAANEGGEGPLSAAALVQARPPPIIGFAASVAPSSRTVTLTWPPADPNAPAPITSYQLHRLQGTTWTLIAQPSATATSHQDPGRAWAATESYRLTAVNAAGAGPPTTAQATIGPEPMDMGLDIDLAYVCPAPVGRTPDENGCANTATGWEWSTAPGELIVTARVNGDLFYVESGPARHEPFHAWTTTLVERYCDESTRPGCVAQPILRTDRNATFSTNHAGQIFFDAQTDAWTLPAGECHNVWFRAIGTHPRAIEDTVHISLMRFCA